MNTGTITRFMDMHSGGGTKLPPYERIYIEACEDEAIRVFYNRFGRNPNRVTCTCCGEDYSIDEYEDLAQASGFDRNCEYTDEYHETPGRYVEKAGSRSWRGGVYRTLEEHLALPDVLFIPASDIKPEERVGDVPEEGYQWV